MDLSKEYIFVLGTLLSLKLESIFTTNKQSLQYTMGVPSLSQFIKTTSPLPRLVNTLAVVYCQAGQEAGVKVTVQPSLTSARL